MLNVEIASHSNMACLISNDHLSWLWHKKIAHIHMNHRNKLVFKELVRGLPKLKFEKDGLCNACQKGKQTRASFKSKNVISTSRALELLHLDLFGSSRKVLEGITMLWLS